jgi:phage protein D
MVVQLWEQLLLRERELNEWENALMAREDDAVAAEHALGRACMECDVEHDRVEAI